MHKYLIFHLFLMSIGFIFTAIGAIRFQEEWGKSFLLLGIVTVFYCWIYFFVIILSKACCNKKTVKLSTGDPTVQLDLEQI
jgi:hypothetical protein